MSKVSFKFKRHLTRRDAIDKSEISGKSQSEVFGISQNSAQGSKPVTATHATSSTGKEASSGRKARSDSLAKSDRDCLHGCKATGAECSELSHGGGASPSSQQNVEKSHEKPEPSRSSHHRKRRRLSSGEPVSSKEKRPKLSCSSMDSSRGVKRTSLRKKPTHTERERKRKVTRGSHHDASCDDRINSENKGSRSEHKASKRSADNSHDKGRRTSDRTNSSNSHSSKTKESTLEKRHNKKSKEVRVKKGKKSRNKQGTDATDASLENQAYVLRRAMRDVMKNISCTDHHNVKESVRERDPLIPSILNSGDKATPVSTRGGSFKPHHHSQYIPKNSSSVSSSQTSKTDVQPPPPLTSLLPPDHSSKDNHTNVKPTSASATATTHHHHPSHDDCKPKSSSSIPPPPATPQTIHDYLDDVDIQDCKVYSRALAKIPWDSVFRDIKTFQPSPSSTRGIRCSTEVLLTFEAHWSKVQEILRLPKSRDDPTTANNSSCLNRAPSPCSPPLPKDIKVLGEALKNFRVDKKKSM